VRRGGLAAKPHAPSGRVRASRRAAPTASPPARSPTIRGQPQLLAVMMMLSPGRVVSQRSIGQNSNIHSPSAATAPRASQIAPIYVSLHRSDFCVA